MDFDYDSNGQTFLNDDFDNDASDYFNENNEVFPFNINGNSNTLVNSNDEKASIENEFEMFDQIFGYNPSISTQNTQNIINKNIRKNSSRDSSKKKIKRKIELSNKAQYLKNNYYLIFTKKKKFPKTIIKKIHEIMMVHLDLKPMTREIYRFNDKYFEEFANDSEKIIQYLVCHKKLVVASIPELLDYII